MVIMSKIITLHMFLLLATTQFNAEIIEKSKENGLISSYWNNNVFGADTYAFGYEVNDNATGNVQFRDERRYMNGSVEGSFGYVQTDGRVTLTTYVASNKTGYLSSTETFYAKNNSTWMQYWPLNRTKLAVELGKMPMPNITYDALRHLNVSEHNVPAEVADRIMQEQKIKLKSLDLQQDVLDPIARNVLNKEVPVVRHKNGTLSFQNITHFFPSQVPIVPFQLPETEHDSREITSDRDFKERSDLLPAKPLVSKHDKYTPPNMPEKFTKRSAK